MDFKDIVDRIPCNGCGNKFTVSIDDWLEISDDDEARVCKFKHYCGSNNYRDVYEVDIFSHLLGRIRTLESEIENLTSKVANIEKEQRL